MSPSDLASTLRSLLPASDPLTTQTFRVAYSGGADSHALLELAVSRYGARRVRAVHVDHGLQPGSRGWAEHCRRVAARLGVGFDCLRVRPPVARAPARIGLRNVEAWARAQRYRYWQRLLGPADLLLLAHHLDDQVETIALRLLQGRLPRPMPSRRVLGQGYLLRPLLGISALQLRAYLGDTSQAWVEDPSNADLRFLRNRVRRELLPAVARTSWPRQIERCGELTERLLASFASRAQLAGLDGGKAAGLLVKIPTSGLGEQGLLSLLHLCGVVNAPARQMRQALHQLSADAGQPMVLLDKEGARIELWSTRIRKLPALVVWRAPARVAAQGWVSVERASGTAYMPAQEFAHGRLRVATRSNNETLAGVYVRFAAPGDRLVGPGGQQRRVVELLREARVPRWERASFPVLIDASGLLCVPGIATRGDALITASWHRTD